MAREEARMGNPEQMRDDYYRQLRKDLMSFSKFVDGEIERLAPTVTSYHPSPVWFYREAAAVLPAIINGTATERDELRLCMATSAIALEMEAEDRILAYPIDEWADVEAEEEPDSARSRLKSTCDRFEVPFQHPWVFHVEYAEDGTPHVPREHALVTGE